jgi:drug/metabolite transporter (DMT)-like permease
MGLLLFYSSYRYIPLPDVTTCRYTQVVWTAIIAMIIFHERISIATLFAIMFTLTGVTFVAQPTFLFNNNHQILSNETNTTDFEADKSYRVLGLSLGLGCAVSISFSIVLNKKLILSKIPQSIIMFQLSFLNLCLLILYHIYNRFILCKYAHQTMFTWQYFVAASVSLFQVFSTTITQKAIKLEHPSIIAVVQSSDIIFAILLQNLFTRVKSNSFVLIGSFLVTTSIFLVGINKFRQDQNKSSEKDNTNMKV